jgi:hypothetical protein
MNQLFYCVINLDKNFTAVFEKTDDHVLYSINLHEFSDIRMPGNGLSLFNKSMEVDTIGKAIISHENNVLTVIDSSNRIHQIHINNDYSIACNYDDGLTITVKYNEITISIYTINEHSDGIVVCHSDMRNIPCIVLDTKLFIHNRKEVISVQSI